jgi:F-type H+-transporting ATPase subunit b
MTVLGFIIRPLSECGVDENGECVTHHSLLPETSEIIWGGLASLIIFALLYKFGWPAAKKAFQARTARVQKELDDAAADSKAASCEAFQIRQAKGDIDTERERILAEADEHAEALLTEGRARLQEELVELEAKAQSDIAAGNLRVRDELRAEIARLSNAAVDHVVTGSLDSATQQQLIESFISTVGASA